MTSTSPSIRLYATSVEPPEARVRPASKCGAMLRCLELARIASRSSAPVLVTGEIGAGKSVLAKMIHCESRKSSMPCIVLNCAAMAGRNLKTVLLGDPGARGGHGGLLDNARGGTLLVDDVDQLPPFMQNQFLELVKIEQGGQRLGVRLVSTSTSQMSREVASGMFVENLVYQLGEITIRIPPLRERKEDLEDLAAAAVKAANRTHGKNIKGLSRTASDFIRHYTFPGNVSELFFMIDRAVRDIDRDIIYVEDLGLDHMDGDPHLFPNQTILPLGEMEKRHIHRALLKTGWKKKAAAHLLRISESMLTRKIRLYRLERHDKDE